MGDLTKNLSRHEFACKCGCGFDTMDWETVTLVQALCDRFNTKVLVHSGCRCTTYNRKVGGAKDSQHIKGRAMDISLEGVSPETVYEYLDRWNKDNLGLGLYKTFVHVDTRSSGKARW